MSYLGNRGLLRAITPFHIRIVIRYVNIGIIYFPSLLFNTFIIFYLFINSSVHSPLLPSFVPFSFPFFLPPILPSSPTTSIPASFLPSFCNLPSYSLILPSFHHSFLPVELSFLHLPSSSFASSLHTSFLLLTMPTLFLPSSPIVLYVLFLCFLPY